MKTLMVGISKSIKDTVESWGKKDNSFLHIVTPRYESVIVDKGNGEWYHGKDNPLEHKWIVKGNLAICSICQQKVERRIVNEGYRIVYGA